MTRAIRDTQLEFRGGTFFSEIVFECAVLNYPASASPKTTPILSTSTPSKTAKTLTAECRPAQKYRRSKADQTRINGRSRTDQNAPFLLVDKTPKAKLRDGVFWIIFFGLSVAETNNAASVISECRLSAPSRDTVSVRQRLPELPH